jgi:high-temperature-induced dauer-formation protein
MQANTSYLPGSQKSLSWAPEMIMLFWEALQSNKRFRSFIIDTERSHDFVILILFYALENRNDPSKQGLIRMCIFVLQTMSVEPNFGKSLNKRFDRQETLPVSIRIPNFHGTQADYLITVSTLLHSETNLNHFCSLSILFSQQAKVGWRLCILLYLPFLTILHRTSRT